MATTRRKPAHKAAAAMLPPLPHPFTDLLTDAERRELHATGMDEQEVLAFIAKLWLRGLIKNCVEEARKEECKTMRKLGTKRKGAK